LLRSEFRLESIGLRSECRQLSEEDVDLTVVLGDLVPKVVDDARNVVKAFRELAHIFSWGVTACSAALKLDEADDGHPSAARTRATNVIDRCPRRICPAS